MAFLHATLAKKILAQACFADFSGVNVLPLIYNEKEMVFKVVVFESFPDHITTFNWYRVDNKTGKIERLDIATDTWNGVK